MIRIISNATVGCHINRRVVKKTKDSSPFSLDPEVEAELVESGIAEYADEPAGEVSLDYLKSLKMSDLKEFAESIGVKYKAGTKKDAFAEIVWDAYKPPAFNPFSFPEGDEYEPL